MIVFHVLQLGPYLETLKGILADFFNINDLRPEQTFKLKLVFEALDRPEFLQNVPKVSNLFKL